MDQESTVFEGAGHLTSVASGGLPMVAIVGRPNAGKSTLFNKLLRQRKAVVDETPGVTRDRNFAQATWNGIPFLLVDTGGFEAQGEEGIVGLVRSQTLLAMEEASAVIFLFDGKAGLSPADMEAVNLLRKAEKPVFFAVNKIDSEKQEEALYEFCRTGVESLFPISAAHNRGVSDLMEKVVSGLPQPDVWETAEQQEGIRVAIVGRPNVGKSSLLNRLVGRERSLVDAMPGTTRDALDTPITWDNKNFLLVDTAGIRRRSRVIERLESRVVFAALHALERSEIGLLVVDGVEGMTDQDARIAHYAWGRGRGLVLVVNKWDLVPRKRRVPRKFLGAIEERFPFVTGLPTAFVSALTGLRVRTLFPLVESVHRAYCARLATPRLNRVMAEAVQHHQPPVHKGRQPKLYYATQLSAKPPHIAVFTNAPESIHPSFHRYLENRVRAAFELAGTPIWLSFRPRP